MSDQIRISDSGELETVPTTWDGEPLYSPSTVAEGLFDADAFKQMKGQMSMGECNGYRAPTVRPAWTDEMDPDEEAGAFAEPSDGSHE